MRIVPLFFICFLFAHISFSQSLVQRKKDTLRLLEESLNVHSAYFSMRSTVEDAAVKLSKANEFKALRSPDEKKKQVEVATSELAEAWQLLEGWHHYIDSVHVQISRLRCEVK